MASNLSSIGFVFADDAVFRDAVERLAGEAAERLACAAGEYAIWRSRTGAELWFHLAPPDAATLEREIVGLTPFFEGRGEVPLTLTQRLQRPGDNAFEGGWSGWVVAPDSGDYLHPIVFDAVDRAAAADLALPRRVAARITGFARKLDVYASEADYLVANADRPQPSALAFLPMGLVAAAASDGEASAALTPASTAIITGRVTDHARLRNEAINRSSPALLSVSVGSISMAPWTTNGK